MRSFALSQNLAVSILVLLLSLLPMGINYVCNSSPNVVHLWRNVLLQSQFHFQYQGADLPFFGCQETENISEHLEIMYVEYYSFSSIMILMAVFT